MRGAWTALIAVVGLAINVAGCAQLRPTQNADEAVIRVGDHDDEKTHRVANYAGHYADYALLAAKAYEPDETAKTSRAFDFVFGGVDQSRIARKWLDRWRYAFGEVGPLCANGEKNCGVPGLGYAVWRKGSERDCSELAIVFRGTDPKSLADWTSNLHWLLRLAPLNDQYEQVQSHTKRIVDRAVALPCFRRGGSIVAVGHSLGGGLAQQAAYMDSRIRRVYAFDPSPVTGSLDRHSNYETTQFGLKIDRVYEHGEVLAYIRYFTRQVLPLPACDPQIRTFRVDLVKGQPFSQHRMRALAAGLVATAGSPGDRAHARPLPGPSAAQLGACASAAKGS